MTEFEREQLAAFRLATSTEFICDIATSLGLPKSRVKRIQKRFALRQLTPLEHADNARHFQSLAVGVENLHLGLSARRAASIAGCSAGGLVSYAKRRGVRPRQNRRRFTVYALRCPLENCVKYVGASSNPKRRLHSHCHSPATGQMQDWLEGLAVKGLRPDLILLAQYDCEWWQDIEREWIWRFINDGHPLLNREAMP